MAIDLERAQEIFDQALALDAPVRREFLLRRCAGDPDLATLVTELLGQHDAMSERSVGASAAGPEHAAPERVGRYRILGRIGAGAMGVVYRAEQERPRRDVALKLIRSAAPTEALRRRFDAESDLLGRLQHPGIAQIFEAGVRRKGDRSVPFIVMELVHGVPLDAFARANGLDARQRLTLLIRVCEALQHAHDRGVAHRDLKPANILVTPGGQPKIVDFGVAHAADADATPGPPGPADPQAVGTLSYMSPEQVGGVPGRDDKRGDVYALGVIAYQLLTGSLPHDLKGQTWLSAARTIRDKGPAPLSSHDRSLRGDLEVIVAGAMDKNPGQRYASPGAFADELGRFLGDEPILRKRPGLAGRTVKLLRRNRVVAATAAAACVPLLAGVVWFSLSRLREQRGQALIAEVERALKNPLDPLDLSARPPDPELVDGAVEKLDAAGLEIDACTAAAYRHRFGKLYSDNGASGKAMVQFRLALDLQSRCFGPDSLVVAETLGLMAWMKGRPNDRESSRAAAGWAERAATILRARRGNTDSQTIRAELDALMFAAFARGESVAGLNEPMLKQIAEARGMKEDPAQLGEHLNRQLFAVESLWRDGDREGAIALVVKEARPIFENPILKSAVAGGLGGYALGALLKGHRPDAAECVATAGVRIGDQIAPGNPYTLFAHSCLGQIHVAAGHFAEGEAELAPTIDAGRAVAPDHPKVLEAMQALARAYYGQKRFQLAEPLVLQVVAKKAIAYPAGGADQAGLLLLAAATLTENKRLDQAEALALECHALASATPDGAPLRTRCASLLGRIYEELGRAYEARVWRDAASAAKVAADTP